MPAQPIFSAKLLTLIVSALIPFAALAEDAPVLKLTVINSSETDVPTYILGHVLQKAGYEVEFVGSGQNMGVVVGDLACAKVSSLYGGLPWTYGLQSKRPSTTGRSALISLTAFLDHTG